MAHVQQENGNDIRQKPMLLLLVKLSVNMLNILWKYFL